MTLFRSATVLACVVVQLAQAQAQAQAQPQPQPAGNTVTEAGITLKSGRVTFPDSDRAFPGGASADVVAQNCTACHSPGMILTQPAMSRSAWQEEVNKMRTTYKAPVAPEDVPAIVSYLFEQKGLK